MTPAQARAIDRQEFEAEAAALRQRAYLLVGKSLNRPQHMAVSVGISLPENTPVRRVGRKAKTYTAHGITRTAAEWSAATGIPAATIVHRIRKGMPIEQAVSTKVGRGRRRKVQ